jgi:2-keto-4-pentenoate hydratase/2-oxohepta-3-ene-1,7-dioic acid hydratase in catechol pathway
MPAVDVADRNHADNLAGRDRCHRLVQKLHSLADATVGNIRLPEQRERVEFEIDVAVSVARSSAPQWRDDAAPRHHR